MPRGIYKHRSPSAKTRLKMSLAHKGKKRSKEICKKLSLAKMGNTFGRGNKGKIHTEETRRKFSEAHKGEKSNLWKGGVSGVSGYKTHHRRMRRAIESGALGSFTIAKWELLKAQYNWTCPCCKNKEPKIILTTDHILPLSKGGSNNIENIQPLCRECNCKKHTKSIKF